MARPLTQSDLIFSTQSLSMSSTLHSLKRSALSTHNRLTSIKSDADFVASVADKFGLPLVANERCGSWYIPPEKKVESVYFKSTDGHTNEWGFSLRRLNFQALDLIGKYDGCVIVDSTRRGKSMPDALSKTIPIWCCVMNRALFSDSGPHELHTPPQAVSQNEHSQIEQRIDGFVRDFLNICKPDIMLLRSKIQKPLRPIWKIQSSGMPAEVPSYSNFHPVVLCTASRRVNGAEGSEGGYIQGAADDHEAWSQGLTAPLFWNNKDELLGTNEEDLPDVIAKLVKEERNNDAVPILVKPTSNLYISSFQNVDLGSFDTIISCMPAELPLPQDSVKGKQHLHLPCQTGKLGSRDLRAHLPRLVPFFAALPSDPQTILVCDPTGKDLAVGVALAILCLHADAEGVISHEPTGARINKSFIKQRLTWLTTTHPTLNPPRGTLQSVNAYLMPDPSKPPSAPSSAISNAIRSAQVTPRQVAPALTFITAGSPPDAPPSPSTIFQSLQNKSAPWKFTRTLTSRLPTHPSGTVTGTATFTPCSSSSSSASTLLYAEEGEFVTTTGLRMTARRKYVYLLQKNESDASEHIAVHFHEEDREGGLGGLFVEMGVVEHGEDGKWRGQSREEHLCGADLYGAGWEFGKGMVVWGEREGERWWSVRYDVKGPKKDYVSDTIYSM